ncbi:hypothetical protein Ciccas_012857, partial [Cichlidogyrus casuarinus]
MIRFLCIGTELPVHFPHPGFDPIILAHYKSFIKGPSSCTCKKAGCVVCEIGQIQRIKHQVEFYFSDRNLKKDDYLRRQLSEDASLSIQALLDFPRMKQLGANTELLKKSLYNSTVVEVDASLGLIRRKSNHLPPILSPLIHTHIDEHQHHPNRLFTLTPTHTPSAPVMKDPFKEVPKLDLDAAELEFGPIQSENQKSSEWKLAAKRVKASKPVDSPGRKRLESTCSEFSDADEDSDLLECLHVIVPYRAIKQEESQDSSSQLAQTVEEAPHKSSAKISARLLAKHPAGDRHSGPDYWSKAKNHADLAKQIQMGLEEFQKSAWRKRQTSISRMGFHMDDQMSEFDLSDDSFDLEEEIIPISNEKVQVLSSDQFEKLRSSGGFQPA